MVKYFKRYKKTCVLILSVMVCNFLSVSALSAKTPDVKNLISEEFDIQNPINWKIHKKEIETKLLTGKIASIQDMHKTLENSGKKSDFDGQVYSAFLDNGLHCVFKINEEENFGENSAELVAYRLSVETNIGNVPPIVRRTFEFDFDGTGEIKTKTGSLGLFVNSKIDLLKLDNCEFFKILNKLDKKELADFKIFNFVFGQWDVGPHNMLISETKNSEKNQICLHPILIDNEGIGNIQTVEYGKVPFIMRHYFDDCFFDDEKYVDIIKNKKFPFSNACFCDEDSRKRVENKYNYSPSKRSHNFVIYNNAYWVQYCGHEYMECVKKLLYTDHIPAQTKETLKALTKEKLFEIFAVNEDTASHGVRQRVFGILERRDMLLDSFSF